MKCNLVQHLKVQTDDTPYSCDSCKKSFSRKSHLITHVRVHTGDKPYKCDECSKACTTKGNLAVHMISHIRAKTCKCDAYNFKTVNKATVLLKSEITDVSPISTKQISHRVSDIQESTNYLESTVHDNPDSDNYIHIYHLLWHTM
jgi:uncharacterized Zn-finger protein